MKTITLNFFEDPGHGWVKVKKELLSKLGIEKKISGCSYMRGDFVYLEEDCDASLLVEKLKEAGYVIKTKSSISDKSSKIRNYDTYEFLTDEQIVRLSKIKGELLKLKNWNRAGVRKIEKAKVSELNYWNEFYNLGL